MVVDVLEPERSLVLARRSFISVKGEEQVRGVVEERDDGDNEASNIDALVGVGVIELKRDREAELHKDDLV